MTAPVASRTGSPGPPGLACPDSQAAGQVTGLREQLSSLLALLALSMLMTESSDARQILHLATTAVPSFGRCDHADIYLTEADWLPGLGPGWVTAASGEAVAKHAAGVRAGFARRLAATTAAGALAGGPIPIPGPCWARAIPLRSLEGQFGYFVVIARTEPPDTEQFLLQALAQQTGVALANARLHSRERTGAEELRAANLALAETVRALERTTRIHDRFTSVAVAGEGQDGIAQALHELTGFPVAVEDRHGNLRAWAGPDRPDPYPKDPAARREQMLRRALREGHPIREGGRLLAIACPRDDVLGVLSLIDSAGVAGEQEQIALEHGATVLAMELARLRSLAETELRLRRDLVEELLAGTDEESALARARALNYDLERPHRVVVIEGRGRTQDKDAFLHAVRRAARGTGAGSLLVGRGATIVLLSDADLPWDRFRLAVLSELGGGRCRVGVGGRCDRPNDAPRSYREAEMALRMQRGARGEDRATCYDDLGVYRLLCEVENPASVERLVRHWLGQLLDYDERKRSDLVLTLSKYLECGGSYDATAAALSVHRSTLKYRLQRIREISGHDLTEPETRFNLELATRAWQTLLALRD